MWVSDSVAVSAVPMAMEDCCSEAVPQDQARASLPRHSISILEALKVSDLTRKRKVDCNPLPKGKRRAHGEGSSEPKTVSPRERVREFPDECLTVTGKGARKLFCIFQNTVCLCV